MFDEEIRRAIRRSARVPLTARLVITATEAQQAIKRAESETIDVSLNGARICTQAELRPEMPIRVFLPSRNRFQLGKVIWAHITRRNEYGIELQPPENFWGIPFSPDRWMELDRKVLRAGRSEGQHGGSIEDASAFWGNRQAPSTSVAAKLSQQCAPYAGSESCLEDAERPDTVEHSNGRPFSIQVPKSGLEVTVGGLTMAGMPFRESSVFLAHQAQDATGCVWLRSVVRDGSRVRVLLPNQVTITARVRSTLNAPDSFSSTNPVIVELPTGITLSRQ